MQNPIFWHQNHEQWSNLNVICSLNFIHFLVDVTQKILSLFYLKYDSWKEISHYFICLFIANVVLGCEKHNKHKVTKMDTARNLL